jgi:hypothetical protein
LVVVRPGVKKNKKVTFKVSQADLQAPYSQVVIVAAANNYNADLTPIKILKNDFIAMVFDFFICDRAHQLLVGLCFIIAN